MQFHDDIRNHCVRALEAAADRQLTLAQLLDSLKSHESASVRLVVGGAGAAHRVGQILAVDGQHRFVQLREIVRPLDRHWTLRTP